MYDWIEEVCTDCAMWIANRDDSAAAPEWDRRAAEATMQIRHMVVILPDAHSFSTRACYCCDTTLAGTRTPVAVEEHTPGGTQ